jgi:hypothetical protein
MSQQNENRLSDSYIPTLQAPAGSSARYADGWLFADKWLSRGGSPDADSPDGWHEEKYEGWWDRLAEAKRVVAEPQSA